MKENKEDKNSTDATNSGADNPEEVRVEMWKNFGQVVVWGRLFAELSNQCVIIGATKSFAEENKCKTQEKQETKPVVVTNEEDSEKIVPSTSQVTEPKTDDAGNQENRTVFRRRTRNVIKRNKDEVITKAAHLRILTSAVRDTFKLKVSEILGLHERPNEPDALNKMLTRSSFRRKSKRGTTTFNPVGNENQDPGSCYKEEVGSDTAQNESGHSRSRRSRNDKNVKPNCTYMELIEKALRENPDGLSVSDIYTWISDRYTYFQSDDPRWKNSVRHNLSVNRCFEKIGDRSETKSGHLWVLREQGPSSCVVKQEPVTKRRRNASVRSTSAKLKMEDEYKHIMEGIKSGLIKVKDEPEDADQSQNLGTFSMPSGGGYISFIPQIENSSLEDLGLHSFGNSQDSQDYVYNNDGSYGENSLCFQQSDYDNSMVQLNEGPSSGNYFLIDESNYTIPMNISNMSDLDLSSMDLGNATMGLDELLEIDPSAISGQTNMSIMESSASVNEADTQPMEYSEMYELVPDLNGGYQMEDVSTTHVEIHHNAPTTPTRTPYELENARTLLSLSHEKRKKN